MTIAILCPTKGRPEQFKRMCMSAYKTAYDSNNLELYPAWSADDIKLYGILNDIPLRLFCVDIMPDGMPTVHKWNMLAQEAMAKPPNNHSLFMLAADDMVFATPHWDKALLDAYEALDNKIHVFALQDSRDAEGTPHIFVTREWIEAMGWFVPPIFLHWKIDTWSVEIAKSAGCFTHLKDYLLIHDKPSDKGEGDATHTGIRAMGWRERDAWVAEHCRDWLDIQKYKLRQAMLPRVEIHYLGGEPA